MTGLPCDVGLADEPLLGQRHLLERQLHAQVAPRHHDGVGRLQDALDVPERRVLLDLGDDPHRATAPAAASASTSSPRRTNDIAMKSAPAATARSTSSASRSLTAGALTSTPGRLMPLFGLSSAAVPDATRHPLVPSPRSTSTASRPSSSRMRGTGTRRPGPGRSYVVGISSAAHVAPRGEDHRAAGREGDAARRAPRPGCGDRGGRPARRSERPSARASSTRCRRRIHDSRTSGVPWEELTRTTSTPASSSESSARPSSHAGPSVATIFVRRTTAFGKASSMVGAMSRWRAKPAV